MRRTYAVVCLESFEAVSPSIVLYAAEIVTFPEVTTRYTAGQRVELSGAKRRKEFMHHHAGKFAIAD